MSQKLQVLTVVPYENDPKQKNSKVINALDKAVDVLDEMIDLTQNLTKSLQISNGPSKQTSQQIEEDDLSYDEFQKNIAGQSSKEELNSGPKAESSGILKDSNGSSRKLPTGSCTGKKCVELVESSIPRRASQPIDVTKITSVDKIMPKENSKSLLKVLSFKDLAEGQLPPPEESLIEKELEPPEVNEITIDLDLEGSVTKSKVDVSNKGARVDQTITMTFVSPPSAKSQNGGEDEAKEMSSKTEDDEKKSDEDLEENQNRMQSQGDHSRCTCPGKCIFGGRDKVDGQPLVEPANENLDAPPQDVVKKKTCLPETKTLRLCLCGSTLPEEEALKTLTPDKVCACSPPENKPKDCAKEKPKPGGAGVQQHKKNCKAKSNSTIGFFPSSDFRNKSQESGCPQESPLDSSKKGEKQKLGQCSPKTLSLNQIKNSSSGKVEARSNSSKLKVSSEGGDSTCSCRRRLSAMKIVKSQDKGMRSRSSSKEVTITLPEGHCKPCVCASKSDTAVERRSWEILTDEEEFQDCLCDLSDLENNAVEEVKLQAKPEVEEKGKIEHMAEEAQKPKINQKVNKMSSMDVGQKFVESNRSIQSSRTVLQTASKVIIKVKHRPVSYLDSNNIKW